MTWTALIPPGGSLIPTDPAKHWRMSDGQRYTAQQLTDDPRNTARIARRTMTNRLANGERDLETIFDRRPSGGAGKRSAKTANSVKRREG